MVALKEVLALKEASLSTLDKADSELRAPRVALVKAKAALDRLASDKAASVDKASEAASGARTALVKVALATRAV